MADITDIIFMLKLPFIVHQKQTCEETNPHAQSKEKTVGGENIFCWVKKPQEVCF